MKMESKLSSIEKRPKDFSCEICSKTNFIMAPTGFWQPKLGAHIFNECETTLNLRKYFCKLMSIH
jgi:hypothetical protein